MFCGSSCLQQYLISIVFRESITIRMTGDNCYYYCWLVVMVSPSSWSCCISTSVCAVQGRCTAGQSDGLGWQGAVFWGFFWAALLASDVVNCPVFTMLGSCPFFQSKQLSLCNGLHRKHQLIYFKLQKTIQKSLCKLIQPMFVQYVNKQMS